MCRIDRFCCGYSLRTGTLVIGWIFIGQGITLLLSSLKLYDQILEVHGKDVARINLVNEILLIVVGILLLSGGWMRWQTVLSMGLICWLIHITLTIMEMIYFFSGASGLYMILLIFGVICFAGQEFYFLLITLNYHWYLHEERIARQLQEMHVFVLANQSQMPSNTPSNTPHQEELETLT